MTPEEQNLDEEQFQKKKEFTYRGKSVEELKNLNMREFSKFLTSRERRTVLRNSDVLERFLAKCNKCTQKNKPIRIHDRNIIIVPAMVGLTVNVYNGKTFEPVRIIPEMMGHRLGEFSLTRKLVKHGDAGIGATRSSASKSVK
ncbi:MAG: 30S ribosomal protein S19 [Candidatus Pacearchaeota archaeon]|jgi:small subunit ribosomal protein S19